MIYEIHGQVIGSLEGVKLALALISEYLDDGYSEYGAAVMEAEASNLRVIAKRLDRLAKAKRKVAK